MTREVLPHDPSTLKDQVSGRLQQDRQETDAALHRERRLTDETVSAIVEEHVDTHLERERGRIDDHIEETRTTTSTGDVLPVVADTLQDAAKNLAAVADDLSQAADTLKHVPPAAEPRAEAIVSRLNDVARDLASAVGGGESDDSGAAAATAPDVTSTLAEVADSLADVAERVAEERRSADETLEEERALLDEVLDRERAQSDSTIEFERQARRVLLEAERQRTNRHLMEERQDTDDAVHHAIGLLIDEQAGRVEAEQRAITRDEFLAIVSHDLRSPLDAIAINATLIAQNAPSGDAGAWQRRWAQNIKRSSETMGRLVSDLLDVARFEGGEFSVVRAEHDVVGLIKEAVETFAPLAHARGLRLDIDTPDGPVLAMFERDRILQVLSNLLRNAVQFTPSGGAIRVMLARTETGCVVAVSDTGVGIPAEHQSRIFERFQQLRSADRRGLGLGLYISRRIVEAHGGRIWVESDVEKGSTFAFTLSAA